MSVQTPACVRSQDGFGLIELMIGVVLGTILLLGLSEVFSASRNTYNTAQGSAEVQENARFAMDFLQRDVRMVGHMGCANDAARFLSNQPDFFSHFLTTTDRSTGSKWASLAPATAGGTAWADTTPASSAQAFAERFDVSVQGFEAASSAPGGALTLATSGTWTGIPTLPAGFPGTGAPAPLPGSDIIMLRFFGTDSAPVTVISLANNTVTAPAFATFEAAQPNGYYAIANCVNASVFQATAVNTTTGMITAAVTPNNQSGFSTGENYIPQELAIYRAESLAYYIATGADGNPSLWKVDYTSGSPVAVEVVQGIDNMQILYGRDTTALTSQPEGFVSEYDTASTINSLAANPNPYWQRVGSARIALLARSSTLANATPTVAGAPNGCAATPNCFSLLGLSVTPPTDGYYREVYVTTIAMRNRLFGN